MLTLVATAAGLVIGVLALLMALDPYDTGRGSLFETKGVRPQGPRTANASRGRDPAIRPSRRADRPAARSLSRDTSTGSR